MTTEQLDATEQVVTAFVNECGGPVVFQLESLMQAPNSSNGVLFEKLSTATKDLFIQNGKSAAEHLLWLSTKMTSACSKIYWQLFSALNPTDNHDFEDAVVITDAKTRIPHVTLEQLAITAAEDFLSHKESSQQGPTCTINHQLDENEAGPSSPTPSPSQNRKGNLPEIHEKQLHGKPLTPTEVVIQFLKANKMKQDENLIQTHLISLSKATGRAATSTPIGPLKQPKRVSKTKIGNWSNIALIHKGPGGTKGEHLYRLIRE